MYALMLRMLLPHHMTSRFDSTRLDSARLERDDRIFFVQYCTQYVSFARLASHRTAPETTEKCDWVGAAPPRTASRRS